MRVAATLLFLSLAAAVQAQPITKFDVRIYNAGAQSPLSGPVDLVVGAGVTCGVDPTTITVTAQNPIKMLWDDITATGKVCVYTDPGTGPLLSTPIGGSFEATLTATNAAGVSAESARAPFSHPGLPPSVPTGLKLGK